MAQTFTDRKQLTAKVARKGWTIYRDSENGMYARNDDKGLDINLMYWNITLEMANKGFVLDDIRKQIDKAEEEWKQMQTFDPDKTFTVVEGWQAQESQN